MPYGLSGIDEYYADPRSCIIGNWLVQQLQEHAFLPGAAGIADQAVGKCSGGENQNVAWPGPQVGEQRGKRSFRLTRHKQVEKCDMAGFPGGQTGGEELAEAVDARAAAASPRSKSACALAAWASAKRGSAAMARSNASIAPGYMVSFASQPSI